MTEIFLTIFFVTVLLFFLGSGIWVALSMIGVSAIGMILFTSRPVGDAMATLIKLVDRVRMLDNDMIRLNTKLTMALENEAKLDKERRAELEEIVNKYSDVTNQKFDSTGKK